MHMKKKLYFQDSACEPGNEAGREPLALLLITARCCCCCCCFSAVSTRTTVFSWLSVFPTVQHICHLLVSSSSPTFNIVHHFYVVVHYWSLFVKKKKELSLIIHHPSINQSITWSFFIMTPDIINQSVSRSTRIVFIQSLQHCYHHQHHCPHYHQHQLSSPTVSLFTVLIATIQLSSSLLLSFQIRSIVAWLTKEKLSSCN